MPKGPRYSESFKDQVVAAYQDRMAELCRQRMWAAMAICMEKSYVERVAVEPPTSVGAMARRETSLL